MCKVFLCKHNTDLGLALLRLGLGLVFLAHGVAKLQALDGTVAFFGSLGLHPLFAYLVAAAETLAGLAMILGLWTHWAAKAIISIMIFAVYFVKFSQGFLGGYEFDLMLLLAALGILYTGPGAYTLLSMLKKKHSAH